jgi:hypothetical protein
MFLVLLLATNQSDCSAGEYSFQATECLKCPVGYLLRLFYEITPIAPNTPYTYSPAPPRPAPIFRYYAPTAQTNTCLFCKGGDHTNNVTGATQCDPCDEGKFSVGSVVECTDCEPGTFSLSRSEVCYQCEAGK